MLWRGKPKAGYGVMARRARALLAAALGCAALATGSAAVAAEADNGAMQDAVSAAGMAAGALRTEQPAEESGRARDTAGTDGDAAVGPPEWLRMEPMITSTGFTEIAVDARVEAVGAGERRMLAGTAAGVYAGGGEGVSLGDGF